MKYFTIEELTRSATASRLKIDNTPPPEAVTALTRLTERLLDPVRELRGGPLIVTSGYRCAALNSAVGGARHSHHMRGMAVDITTGNAVDNRRLFQAIMASGLDFTQMIDERGFSWIHLSFDPDDLRKEVLRL
ncbi:MAG: peptidase M15 [Paramuribaculum sp.]|nr:peptidase M15 [Paramuribaculum sp.]